MLLYNKTDLFIASPNQFNNTVDNVINIVFVVLILLFTIFVLGFSGLLFLKIKRTRNQIKLPNDSIVQMLASLILMLTIIGALISILLIITLL